ncbi:MAG: metallophosphoesterase, partial [Lewinella sp.]|nr:metallophosphoesterase [Lewinella sp.]
MFRLVLLCFLFLAGLLRAQEPLLQIDIPEGAKPWTSLDLNNEADNFQFIIVTDRTGGHRPGVFEDAVHKINLLQPEFVMSVGDLIEGYTDDVAQLDREWNEFTGFTDQLQMPFFYVPGNHDLTNAVQERVWEERFGPTYYHFVYRDVLFLCLNSEDQLRGAGRGTLSDEQFDYVQRVLAEHEEVRWTMLFMHQPLWLYEETERWREVEALLAERKHTVFVGHVHHYVKYERNNGRYYTLATTGGGSNLRGPQLGEFDHVTWVTMTEEGPIMANLALSGIWRDDVVTEKDYGFLTTLEARKPVRLIPPFTDAAEFTGGTLQLRLENPADIPVLVR